MNNLEKILDIINSYKIYDYNPQYELDLETWGGKNNLFNELILKIKPKIIIEIGTFKGCSAITMAQSLKNLNLQNSKIICIDSWVRDFLINVNRKLRDKENLKNSHLKCGLPDTYYRFLSNVIISNCQQQIIPFPSTSSQALKFLIKQNIKADLIYIDGSHIHEDVMSDIKNSLKLISENGIIFGHDIKMQQVRHAVFYCLNKEKIKIVDNFWIFNNN